MNYRNLLLLGLSSIALQGCIAAAAIPIVASGGAFVRDGVSDDARKGAREQVAMATPPVSVPAPTPTPSPSPALAAAQPTMPVAAAPLAATPNPVANRVPTPAPSPTTAPTSGLADRSAQPVVVATLDGSRLPAASRATAEPASTPATAEIVPPQMAEEPASSAPEPAASRLADIGLPPEPAAQQPEPETRLATTQPAEQPPAAAANALEAAEAAEASMATAGPSEVEEPATVAAAQPRPTAPSQESGALVSTPPAARPAIEPPVAASSSPAVSSEATAAGYGPLRNYALRTLGGGLPLPSAMLADPTSLQPIRRDCEGNSPTVVIDLDPAGGVVPIAGPLALNNQLARILADLRLRDVQIAWITDRGPIDARAVRDRLVASGLDPQSQDSLYVERYPGETKQARRAALAQTQCVIALAGDERSDFDDLYNFIIDEGDARNLELLLGNGWFLIENPVGG
ncbi:hypothetical protein [Aurantiacibacter zhengii]|uniref:Uncharacterized protein n=1 Tax=Aurantiacibacter zhengii TaxID=2307003 RepID=A0A418NT53_9SPHN|nr:hypothetical protein [Aurantiacibacter zhengii]RIV86759.1 hypothetical protein D2V07_08710 [Aurantiacibacter zhengii]